jgi:hypothetical protein
MASPVTAGPLSPAITKVDGALASADMSVRARCAAEAKIDFADLVTIRDRVALAHASHGITLELAIQLQSIAASFDHASLAERIVFIQTVAVIMAGGR